MSSPTPKIKKIQAGWYLVTGGHLPPSGLHIVRTDSYGEDAAWDWVVTGEDSLALELATKAAHGGRLRPALHSWKSNHDIETAENTLREARRFAFYVANQRDWDWS